MRLRKVASVPSTSGVTQSPGSAGPQTSTVLQQQLAAEQILGLANMPPIVYLVAMLILGLIVGKFVL